MSDNPPPTLTGRRGLILGLSTPNGLGYHCTVALTRRGAQVLTTTRPSRLNTNRPVSQRAGALDCLALDTNDNQQLDAVAQYIQEQWGALDFLVHTLIHIPDGLLQRPVLDVQQQDFTQVMCSAVHSLIAACSAFAPLLRRSPAPRVVTFTSSGDEHMLPNYHLAGIAKAALGATVRYLAFDLGPSGILCNSVRFSLLPTDAADRAIGPDTSARTHAHLAQRAPTRQPLTFDDVTAAVAYLVSDQCSNTTGQVLTVDGGYSDLYFH